ncbi:LysR family transcriptional regulator [Photobacterium rosenbergii]|uniref:LysR family transcriptional regulator n=1 Tax=Photobacterium rosenbergii TaxID=294936 RepID=UPI001C999046|nr:LysR family transcriptional regulator [Photobacterium rosenbergii]MBY5947811.1 LysR family transcriptional regulator [Photobacterium rosenbergii]
MNFSFEQLLAFVSVCERQSFSKAAISLNKHRTTIGQVITNLEDQLAIELFERAGRSVIPTEDGKLLYLYAKQAVEQAKTFDKVALSLSYGGLESITIGYTSFIPHPALAEVRSKLLKDFPTMKVNFMVMTKDEVVKALHEGTVHIGLTISQGSKAIDSLDRTFLSYAKFKAFAHKDSHLAQLSEDEVLNGLKSSRQFVLRSLLDEGFGDSALYSPDYEVIEQLSLIIKFIREGLGWAFLPQSIMKSAYATESFAELKMKEFRLAPQIPVTLLCPHSKQIGNIKQSIIKALENFID